MRLIRSRRIPLATIFGSNTGANYSDTPAFKLKYMPGSFRSYAFCSPLPPPPLFTVSAASHRHRRDTKLLYDGTLHVLPHALIVSVLLRS